MKIFTVFIVIKCFASNAKANNNKCLVSKTYGEGQSIILMPGFLSDESVWQATADRLAANYFKYGG